MPLKNILATLCVVVLTTHFTSAQQQTISERPNVSYSEVIDRIDNLISEGSDEAQNQLRLEAEELAKHPEEDFRALSALMYERLFKDTDKAQEIRDDIEQHFPAGKFARARAFGQLFSTEDLSATEMAQRYQILLQQFPKEHFNKEDLEIYDHATLELATKYASENNANEAIEQLILLEDGKYYVVAVTHTYENISNSQTATALYPLIEKAYRKALTAKASDDEETNSNYDAQFFDPISAVYADILVQSGKLDAALQIAESRLEKSAHEEVNVYRHLTTAVNVLEQQNKKSEALNLLKKHLMATDAAPEMIDVFKRLYVEVNGANADPEVALTTLYEAAKQGSYTRYEKEMIKEEAPGFTLVDREGKNISLSDYKGKVVVLDFWATWCGPCVVSFPGMQAAVNKYQEDPEVEFLFIDTWQREENYKEVVEEFITTNNYSFHVLFDEMKDRSKAVVTAYGVRGIPTKIVIDKNGFIRFRSSGGEQDISKVLSEMEAKIELARRG